MYSQTYVNDRHSLTCSEQARFVETVKDRNWKAKEQSGPDWFQKIGKFTVVGIYSKTFRMCFTVTFWSFKK